ncbi:unnamed protein product [Prorocentrum cordatum]|uniref:Uncharacterized protein n=1 Tax=Prorocentrum cordatum TaxID=2364126 RepID=A0ABN9U9Q7_9DINO|nr:unnamed protein product [Polarella glacialis]
MDATSLDMEPQPKGPPMEEASQAKLKVWPPWKPSLGGLQILAKAWRSKQKTKVPWRPTRQSLATLFNYVGKWKCEACDFTNFGFRQERRQCRNLAPRATLLRQREQKEELRQIWPEDLEADSSATSAPSNKDKKSVKDKEKEDKHHQETELAAQPTAKKSSCHYADDDGVKRWWADGNHSGVESLIEDFGDAEVVDMATVVGSEGVLAGSLPFLLGRPPLPSPRRRRWQRGLRGMAPADTARVYDLEAHHIVDRIKPLDGEVHGFADELLVFVVEDVRQLTDSQGWAWSRRHDVENLIRGSCLPELMPAESLTGKLAQHHGSQLQRVPGLT